MKIIDQHPALIVGFIITIIIMLLLDLGVFNKNSHEVTNKEAVTWSAVWISLSMAFSGVVYWVFSADSHAIALEKFTQFQSAYWIEKALSVDNLFVFILVFSYFKVAKSSQHKVLFWGIIGALVMRAIFIFSGVGLIELTYLPEMVILGYKVKINIIMSLFGMFLVYAGVKSAYEALNDDPSDDEEDFSKSPGAKFVHFLFKGKVATEYDGAKFFTLKTIGNKVVKYATPLLVVVGVIEFTDLLFAVDSIPAIFAISDDPFILYTSNIFAILGLRSLYFLLANFIHMFKFLPYGLAVILSFIGVKMLIAPVYHIESTHSLLVVGGILIISVVASIMFPDKEAEVETE